MTVRMAIPDDKMRVVRMLKDAHAAAGFGNDENPACYPFSAAYAERAFLSHTSADNAACIILDIDDRASGVLMARVFDYGLGPIRVAKETVWWVDEAYRGSGAASMLDVYEEWAKSAGASFAGMAALSAAPRAGIIYRRKGYDPVETHFVKSLAG